MTSEADLAEGDSEYLGYYSLADGAKLFEAFMEAGIGYAADLIDSTGAISPAGAYVGGAFGNAVRVL